MLERALHLLIPGDRTPTRARAALFLYLGLGLMAVGGFFCLRELRHWRDWPHVIATVSGFEGEGRDARILISFTPPGGAARVQVVGRLGEGSAAPGERFEVAVDPSDPSHNTTRKAGLLLLALPVMGLVLAAAMAGWLRRADAAGVR